MDEQDHTHQELTEYREELLSKLEVVAGALSVTAGKIKSTHWHIPGQPGGYSPHYILTRLLVLEEQVYAAYLRHILDEAMQELPHFDEVAWMAVNYDPQKPLPVILDEFMRLRKVEVDRLRALTPGNWNRLSRHPWWGVRTLQWWVEHQLKVSLQHLRDLEASIAQ